MYCLDILCLLCQGSSWFACLFFVLSCLVLSGLVLSCHLLAATFFFVGESEGAHDVGGLSHGQRGPIWEIELERGKRLGREERGEGLEILELHQNAGAAGIGDKRGQ